MISFRPTLQALGNYLGATPRDLSSLAIDKWEVAPSTKRYIPPAKFLPGQLERIRGTHFASLEETVRALQGGFEATETPTLGFRVKSVDLVDGVLYAKNARMHLRQRHRRFLTYRVPTEVMSGAMYETWVGNRWFGNWLSDDCLTYPLAAKFGSPVTTTPASSKGHTHQYEALLDMHPQRTQGVHFDELILFQDGSHNENKRERAVRLRERLVATASPVEHPGVFLLRGNSGEKRILVNEHSIAEQLATKRGFKVIDPEKASLKEIIDACAKARVIAGVEGSHLVHGLMLMPRRSVLFVIQPPHRVVSILKLSADRQGLIYSFLVATGTHDEFSVSFDEVERSIDMALHG